MRAKYESAEMELVLFASEDVITLSIGEDDESGMGVLE